MKINLTKKNIKKNKKNTKVKIVRRGGSSENNNITDNDIDNFIKVISEQHLQTSNFDKLCRENPVLLKFFKKPSDCDLLFLNLLSKKQIVSDMINFTTQEPQKSVRIDDITHFIEENSCMNNFTGSISSIPPEVKKAVRTIFKKFLSEKKEFLQDFNENKNETNQKLDDFLQYVEKGHTKKEDKLYEQVVKELLDVYFGIYDKNFEDSEKMKLCKIVDSFFNLTRLLSLLVIDSIQNHTNILKLDKDKIKEKDYELLMLKIQKLINKNLIEFINIYYKSTLPQSGGSIVGGLKKIAQFFVRPIAAVFWISTSILSLMVLFALFLPPLVLISVPIVLTFKSIENKVKKLKKNTLDVLYNIAFKSWSEINKNNPPSYYNDSRHTHEYVTTPRGPLPPLYTPDNNMPPQYNNPPPYNHPPSNNSDVISNQSAPRLRESSV